MDFGSFGVFGVALGLVVIFIRPFPLHSIANSCRLVNFLTVSILVCTIGLLVGIAGHKRPASVGPWGWQRPGLIGIHLLMISESKLNDS